jgi:hypothetical protein
MENERGEPTKKPEQARQNPREASAPAKKMTGVGFYMVLGVVAVNDVAGVVADSTIVLFFIPVFTGIVAQGITFLYLYWNGVKLSDRKLAIILVSSTIEIIPFLNLLPAGTVNLLAIRAIENSSIARKFAKRDQT